MKERKLEDSSHSELVGEWRPGTRLGWEGRAEGRLISSVCVGQEIRLQIDLQGKQEDNCLHRKKQKLEKFLEN